MRTKTVRKYVDEGFGFPIILENVTLVNLRGRWTPKLNYAELAKELLSKLPELGGRLTGNQVRFIRNHFELTLQQFAARFSVSHPAVKKWEARGNEPTNMSWSTEKDIRLFIKKSLESKPKDFLSLYAKLETPTKEGVAELRLSAETLAV